MKRSEINRLINESIEFFDRMNFKLPKWAYWNSSEWKGKGEVAREVVENMLGWDITDFGTGDFQKYGLILFTVRNGNLKSGDKPYAEKIMISDEGQITPLHFHWSKMEDIINRGGGNLAIELYGSTEDEKLSDKPVSVQVDGITQTVDAGAAVVLTPGESICLTRGLYHAFQVEPGTGKVLIGEVSAVNDDTTDNRFYDKIGRFPEIEEDVEPQHLLVTDYSRYI
jgi:D-lyxose ketol-isomerase